MESTTKRAIAATAIVLASCLARCAFAAPPELSTTSPLHTAAEQGDPLAVMRLIAGGTHVDAMDGQRRTPLILAAAHGHADVVALLLAGGADPNRCAANDENVRYGWAPPLFSAVSHDNEKMVRLLLRYGADPNSLHTEPGYGTMYQSTPLHLATRRGNLRSVRILLDHGADANRGVWSGTMFIDRREVVFHGHTPLHTAAEYGQAEIAERLIHRGADIHARTHDGQTPLDIAHDGSDVRQLLINHGAARRGAE